MHISCFVGKGRPPRLGQLRLPLLRDILLPEQKIAEHKTKSSTHHQQPSVTSGANVLSGLAAAAGIFRLIFRSCKYTISQAGNLTSYLSF
jgi:hypothetical protein